jgi:hypothetical protein
MSDENPFIMPPERLERLREKLFDAEGKYWSAGVKKNKKKVCPFGAHESMNRIKTAKVAPGDSLVIEGVRKCPACAHVDVQRLSGAAKTAVANDHWERMIYRQLNDLTATASPAYSIWENYNPPEGTS